MKKDKIDISTVKEELQKENALVEKRNEKSLSEKEKLMLKDLYPMTPNKDLATQFIISTEDVERFAHEHGLCKDPAFTQYQMVTTGKDRHLNVKKGDGSAATPGYLITSIQKSMTEEERRQMMMYYQEGLDPIEMLEQLAYAQLLRVQRGIQQEHMSNQTWRAVNDTVDTMHTILKSIHELKHGSKVVHELTLDEMILRSQGKL